MSKGRLKLRENITIVLNSFGNILTQITPTRNYNKNAVIFMNWLVHVSVF